MVVNRITTMGGRAGGGAGGGRSWGGGQTAWGSKSPQLKTEMKMAALNNTETGRVNNLVKAGMSGQAAIQYVKTGRISTKNAITGLDRKMLRLSSAAASGKVPRF